MSVQTESFFAGTSITALLVSLREQYRDAVAKRKVYLTTLRELESLTKRDLSDLGIAPGSVKDIAYEAAYGA
jgi:uncharacterized protein YjiS (DUF1127 family)